MNCCMSLLLLRKHRHHYMNGTHVVYTFLSGLFSGQSDITETEEHVQIAHQSHCVELPHTVVIVVVVVSNQASIPRSS